MKQDKEAKKYVIASITAATTLLMSTPAFAQGQNLGETTYTKFMEMVDKD